MSTQPPTHLCPTHYPGLAVLDGEHGADLTPGTGVSVYWPRCDVGRAALFATGRP